MIQNERNEDTGTQRASAERRMLGVIGMGHMGSHMARRLLAAGYQLVVHDRTKEKAQELGPLGALIAPTPRELATHSDVVLVSVTDDAAQEQVMFGQDGALQGLRDGSLI